MRNMTTLAERTASLAQIGSAPTETMIDVQSLIPSPADQMTMLIGFAVGDAALTCGEVKIGGPPASTLFDVRDRPDAVGLGPIEGGYAWTHEMSGKNPATMFFDSLVADACVGQRPQGRAEGMRYAGYLPRDDAVRGDPAHLPDPDLQFPAGSSSFAQPSLR